MPATKKKTRRTLDVSAYVGHVDVEVDLDEAADALMDEGWHHEDECPTAEGHDDTRRALSEWHDREHGLTDWVTCRQGPCDVIPAAFKDTRHL